MMRRASVVERVSSDARWGVNIYIFMGREVFVASGSHVWTSSTILRRHVPGGLKMTPRSTLNLTNVTARNNCAYTLY